MSKSQPCYQGITQLLTLVEARQSTSWIPSTYFASPDTMYHPLQFLEVSDTVSLLFLKIAHRMKMEMMFTLI